MGCLVELKVEKQDREPASIIAALFRRRMLGGAHLLPTEERETYHEVRFYLPCGENKASMFCHEAARMAHVSQATIIS